MNIDIGKYQKTIWAVIVALATQFDFITYNDAGQILIDPPKDLIDSAVKVAAIGAAVYYIKNKGEKNETTDKSA